MGMAESAQMPVHMLQTCPHFEEARLQSSSLAYRSSSQREALGVWRRPTENDQLLRPDRTTDIAKSKKD